MLVARIRLKRRFHPIPPTGWVGVYLRYRRIPIDQIGEWERWTNVSFGVESGRLSWPRSSFSTSDYVPICDVRRTAVLPHQKGLAWQVRCR